MPYISLDDIIKGYHDETDVRRAHAHTWSIVHWDQITPRPDSQHCYIKVTLPSDGTICLPAGFACVIGPFWRTTTKLNKVTDYYSEGNKIENGYELFGNRYYHYPYTDNRHIPDQHVVGLKFEGCLDTRNSFPVLDSEMTLTTLTGVALINQPWTHYWSAGDCYDVYGNKSYSRNWACTNIRMNVKPGCEDEYTTLVWPAGTYWTTRMTIRVRHMEIPSHLTHLYSSNWGIFEFDMNWKQWYNRSYSVEPADHAVDVMLGECHGQLILPGPFTVANLINGSANGKTPSGALGKFWGFRTGSKLNLPGYYNYTRAESEWSTNVCEFFFTTGYKDSSELVDRHGKIVSIKDIHDKIVQVQDKLHWAIGQDGYVECENTDYVNVVEYELTAYEIDARIRSHRNGMEFLRDLAKIRNIVDPTFLSKIFVEGIFGHSKRTMMWMISQGWLWYQFGVKPLAKDIEAMWIVGQSIVDIGLYETLLDTDKRMVLYGGREKDSHHYDILPDGVTLPLTVVHTVKLDIQNKIPELVWYLAHIIKTWKTLDSLSIAPTFESLWDLIPYSFVVDWWVDIGGCLNRIDNSVRMFEYTLHYRSYSKRSYLYLATALLATEWNEQEYRAPLNMDMGLEDDDMFVKNGRQFFGFSHFTRIVDTRWPVMPFYWKSLITESDVSWGQIAYIIGTGSALIFVNADIRGKQGKKWKWPAYTNFGSQVGPILGRIGGLFYKAVP